LDPATPSLLIDEETDSMLNVIVRDGEEKASRKWLRLIRKNARHVGWLGLSARVHPAGDGSFRNIERQH